MREPPSGRYLREKLEKSSKSAPLRTGKIIPVSCDHASVTTGTRGDVPPFQFEHKNGRLAMYIGLGGLLILILILWLLGVI